MACVRSTKLRDSELLAYLAGDADATMSSHLAHCKECQQRAAVLAAQEQQLTTTLYRMDCPSSLQVGEYHMGLLSAAESRAVAAHLRHCPLCTDEVVMLTNYLADVAPSLDRALAPSLVARTRSVVARLVDGLSTLGGQGSFTPALAGLRGEIGDHRLFEADGVQVMIDVQEDGEHPAQRVLLGLLLGLPDPHAVTAHLWRDDRPVTTTTVDELGNFIIPALTPGLYDLILSSDKAEVHIQALAI
jgi:hypothetical protein